MSINFPGSPGIPPPNNPVPPAFTSALSGGGGGGGEASVSAGIDFPPSPKASICSFSLGLPRLKFGFSLPSIPFPPKIPLPYISFKLSCKLPNPVDVTAGLSLPYGGGRTFNAEPNPDNNDDSP